MQVPAQYLRNIWNAPQIAYDPVNGNLYMAYVDGQVAGQNFLSDPEARVYLVSCPTTVNGVTNLNNTDPNYHPVWASPLEVDPSGAAPPAPNGTAVTQFNPAISVDPASGLLGILFYTTGPTGTGNTDAVVPELAVDLNPSNPQSLWIDNSMNGDLTPSDMYAYDHSGAPGVPNDDYLEYSGLTMLDGSAYTAWSFLATVQGSQTTLPYFATAPFPGDNTLQLTGTDPLTISIDPLNSAYLKVANSFTQAVVYDGFIASVGQIAVTGVPNLTIDDTHGNPIPSGGLSYDGDGGSGTLKVITTNANSQSDVTNVTASGFSLLGSPVTYQAMSLLDFDVHGGTFTVPGDLSVAPAHGVQVDVESNAAVVFSASQHLAALNLNGSGSKATLAQTPTDDSEVLYLGGLSIYSGSPAATLDLGNNMMFLIYAAGGDPVSSIRAWLTSGYSAGAWNGTGIDSSAANARNTVPSTPLYGLGYADSADGSGVVTTPNTILVMFTVEGDANLDGTTNTTDFTTLSRNFGAGGTWDTGDFNYDGISNLADLLILTRNFGKSA